MKLLIATAALMLAAAPALAQTPAPAAPAPAAAPATAAPSGALTADSPIETLMATPASKEAVLKSFPKLDEHPAYEQFKAMSLRQLVAMLNGAIPMEKVDEVDKALAQSK
ncbi:hypothetical protein V7S57_00650 [Caulobacter sp. CCNWLY153]|uniref:hypothetical protein n=1 Tax=Caulobacter TaxID=75 RepID=UPI001403C101|nr:hypothetical protein [Caulobacter radicis]